MPSPHTAHVLREIPHALPPEEAVARLRRHGCPWWLDSASAPGPQARWSFLGADPYAVVRVRGDRLSLEVRRDADPRLRVGRETRRTRVLEGMRALLPPAPDGPPPPFPFAGGAVGMLGYELAAQWLPVALHARDTLGLPDAVWLLVDRVLVVDHARGGCAVSALGMGASAAEARRRAGEGAETLLRQLDGDATPTRPWPAPRGASVREEPFDTAAYAKSVDAILHEIARGNVYQACLTARRTRRCAADPLAVHRALRRRNPAPFAAFLELPELALVGSSPERFLRVTREGAVESRPIKGTARRGDTPTDDAARRAALAASEKDRAENLMIVDLVRNDLGRVCETGSVHVPELFAVEAHPAVFQMVSTVRGHLAEGRDALDAVAAAFPPGSMTGAPKIAAMRLLGRLEPVRRGPYAGALGTLDAWGGAELSVVIRTLLLTPGRATLHAGGGIVADSRPEAEVREALDKLAPLEAALDEVGGTG